MLKFLNRLDRESWRAIGLLLTLVAVGILWAKTAWLSEDSYITFRVADNFLEGYGLRWNVAERVQAYTHPLWLMLFVACGHVTRRGFAFSFGFCAFEDNGISWHGKYVRVKNVSAGERSNFSAISIKNHH